MEKTNSLILLSSAVVLLSNYFDRACGHLTFSFGMCELVVDMYRVNRSMLL